MNFRQGMKKRRRALSVEINITPLVDIVFNLLIFFMLTTTFKSQSGLEIQLPRAKASGLEQEPTELTIALTASGQIIIDNRAVSDEGLEEAVLNKSGPDKSLLVILQADRSVVHGRVVRVLDILKSAGFQRIAIAAESE